jgi:U3 small nucleolar RNA-associated protein 4
VSFDWKDPCEALFQSGFAGNTDAQSTYPIPSPPLWSISVSPTHKYICLATSSPSLHFLSIPSTPTPLEPPPSHLLRSDTLPSRTRTVSLAWAIPKLQKGEEGWEWRDSYIITGNSDSSFRKWEIPASSSSDGSRQGQGRVVLKSRAVVEKIGKIKGKKVNGKGTIVWGVGVLP